MRQKYRSISLTQGQQTKVSPEDYDRLLKIRWQAHWSPLTNSYYVHGSRKVNGKWRMCVMARLIVGLKPRDKRRVDHINRDTLDNRRSNLRVCSNGQNQMNKGVRKDSKTGLKGVYLRSNGRYRVCIRANDRRITVGHYATAEEAKTAYAKAARQYHREFARPA